MLGEPSGAFKKILRNEDVGTRIQHMMELQDLWSTAYGILTRPKMYHTPLEIIRAKALETALDLLQHHMEAEFDVSPYAKEINKASDKPANGFTTFRDTV